MKAKYSMP